jgi:hypothetical protein
MTASLRHADTRRFARVPALIVGAFFGALLWLSLSELNPDWLAYRLIFESNGAWLGESGRDLAFLGLNSLMSVFLGEDGYETFRGLMAVYFFVFSIALVTGRLSTLKGSRKSWLSFSLAVIYLGFARFTIQIREGLAITIVMIAIALFQRNEQRACAPDATLRGQWLPWGLMILAAGTHASMGFVLLIALAGRWVAGSGASAQPALQAGRRRAVWIVAICTAILITVQLKYGGALDEIASETLGDRLIEQKDVTASQFAFWAIYGLVCLVVHRQTRIAVHTSSRLSQFEATLQVLAGPAMFAVYFSIIAALSLGITGLVISSYARLLYMFLALNIIYLAILGRRSWQLTLGCAFLLLDQMRNIADSISIYFGVDLY